jgi:hypothetical protein
MRALTTNTKQNIIYENLKKDISLLEEKRDALKAEYGEKIEALKATTGEKFKALASNSNTSSEDLEDIYIHNLTFYEEVDRDDLYIVKIDYLHFELEDELSKNINTPSYILNNIAKSEVCPESTCNNAHATINKQSLLITRNLKSTTEELNEVLLWSDDTYLALAKHPNTSSSLLDELVQHQDMDMYIDIVNHLNVTPEILDKISCIFDEVDALILKHPKVYVKTMKKINKNRGYQ